MPPKKSAGKEFQWSDDEAELLLTVTHEYKVKKVAEGIDWESVKSKYSDILELMKNELPSTAEERTHLLKDYCHTKEQISKQTLTNKLKAVRLKFRQAVDSGRRSGHGRVVMLYYELCERIWGGSPATQQIETGVETADMISSEQILPHNISEDESQTDTEVDDGGDSAATPDYPPNEPSMDQTAASGDAVVQHRRELLGDKLKNFRQEKLKRKLPADAQLLECAKEELQVKRMMVEQMNAVDREYNENMKKISNNMEKLNSSIADGFSLLRNLLTPGPPQPMYSHPPYSSSMYGHPLGEHGPNSYQ